MLTGIAAKLTSNFNVGVDMRACGIFYRLSSSHYFLPSCDVPANADLVKGDQLPLSGMCTIWFALNKNGEKVGFIITSSFPMLDKGGVLIACLNKGRGRASSVEVHLKTKEILVYHFPNRGTMIVNPQIGDSMRVILEEQ